MSDKFDPGAAAALATGDDPAPTADATDAADAGETTTSSSSSSTSTSTSIFDALRSTEPDPPLDTVESPWDPNRGGRVRIYRGLQKALDMDGTPAAVDLVVGALEELSDIELDVDDQDDDQEGELALGGDAV